MRQRAFTSPTFRVRSTRLRIRQEDAIRAIRGYCDEHHRRSFTFAEFAALGLYRHPWPALQRLVARHYVNRGRRRGTYVLAAPAERIIRPRSRRIK